MTSPSVAAGVAAVAALRAGGVDQVVLSPGSRSAPLARAAAAAELAGDITLHVRVDERSAGFLAVGLAKASGSPVAVVCTSGTAAANLLPAVVEARYAGVSLVVLTADRPPELRGRGASQTIDQVGMFDQYVLASRDVPVPAEGESWPAEQLAALVALSARARGPVHANLPLRPPLVGALPPSPAARVEGATAGVSVAGGIAAGSAPDLGALPTRGAIVAGDLDVWDTATRDQICELAAATGWPIIAEASSGLLGAPATVPGAAALLAHADARAELRADLVLTFGPFGLDRGVLAYVREAARHVAVRLRPRTDPPDPLGTAEQVLTAVPQTHGVRADPAWLDSWHTAVESRAAPADPLVAVATQIWQAMQPQDLLFVASSQSIRALAAAASGAGPHVLANRGANGIDGLVSTAWGAAWNWPARTVALLGDLAFLHDQNGLLVPRVEPDPDLTFVIADSNGGGIFRTLEQGAPEYADTFDRVFGTPHDRDLIAVLAAAGVRAQRVGLAQVGAALREAPSAVSALVVQV